MKRFLLTLFLMMPRFAQAGEAIEEPLSRMFRIESTLKADSPVGREAIAIVTSILTRHKIPHLVESLPMQRGIEEIKRGRVDGSLARVKQFAKIYGISQYERVNFPLITLTLSLVCRPEISQTVPYEILPELKLGYLLGSTLALQTISLIDNPRVKKEHFNSYLSGMSMLKKRRLDCLIGSDTVMEEAGVNLNEFQNFRVHRLLTYSLYPWVSKNFSEVKAVLDSELPKYPFDPDWSKKFRSIKADCSDQNNVLCPDGIIFTKSKNLDVES